LIDAALHEDLGDGDLSARYFVPAEREVRGFVVAREEGVISGIEVALEVFRRVEPGIEANGLIEDGARVGGRAHVIELRGPARGVLSAERTALNFLQRLSGGASATARYVAALAGTEARLLDTRKTTPGWRRLEKQAVLDGGGTNHRMGLYDRVMVKDNHLVAEYDLEGLQAAIDRVKRDHPEIEVELEADTLEQVERFLGLAGIDHLLLDNMSVAELVEAVALRGARPRPRLEASGGVTLETIGRIAATGVDFVSVGAITHSAPALDLGLDFVPMDG